MTIKKMQAQKAATRRFSDQVYEAKRRAGLSLNQLGQAVGLSGNQCKELMKNPDKMSLKHLRDFCNTLDIPAEEFLIAYGFREVKSNG